MRAVTMFGALLLAATRLLCSPAEAAYNIVPALDWTMASRFGLDRNSNFLPDLPNTREYLLNLPAGACRQIDCDEHLPKFLVTLDASGSTVVKADPNAPEKRAIYRWAITGPWLQQPIVKLSRVSRTTVELPEGEYRVELTVYAATAIMGNQPVGAIAQASKVFDVVVDDILIVSIGDSFSSGQGNPERFRNAHISARWADDGGTDPNSLINRLA